jgi:hypothetical protein
LLRLPPSSVCLPSPPVIHACLPSSAALAERTSGYAHGTLLVVRDAGGFVFGAWAPKGLNPNPPSATAPPREPDFSGSDAAVLLRLYPSLLVCRTRRALKVLDSAAARVTSGAAAHGGMHRAGGGSAPPHAPASVSVPADQRYLYFNNRRSGKRGIGLGGSLRAFRLYVDAALETGCSAKSCETFADGALTSADQFEISQIECWGCGGREGERAQGEWKEEQADMRRRSVRRAIVGDDDDDARDGGVAGGGVGKEDRWMLGLLGMFGGYGHARDARQDAAYAQR